MLYGPLIIRDGLRVYCNASSPLSYQEGDSTWKNLLDNDQGDFDIYGTPTFEKDYRGGRIMLDGIGDYLELPSNANRNFDIRDSTFTLVFDDSRVDQIGVSTYLYMLASVYSNLWQRDSAGVHYIRVNNVTDATVDLGTVDESVIHYTLVCDYDYMCSFYINGELRHTQDYSGFPTNYQWSYDLELGRLRNGSSYDAFSYYSVAIYDRALSEREVLHNYRIMSGRVQ
jgi:hypothetical protein